MQRLPTNSRDANGNRTTTCDSSASIKIGHVVDAGPPSSTVAAMRAPYWLPQLAQSSYFSTSVRISKEVQHAATALQITRILQAWPLLNLSRTYSLRCCILYHVLTYRRRLMCSVLYSLSCTDLSAQVAIQAACPGCSRRDWIRVRGLSDGSCIPCWKQGS